MVLLRIKQHHVCGQRNISVAALLSSELLQTLHCTPSNKFFSGKFPCHHCQPLHQPLFVCTELKIDRHLYKIHMYGMHPVPLFGLICFLCLHTSGFAPSTIYQPTNTFTTHASCLFFKVIPNLCNKGSSRMCLFAFHSFGYKVSSPGWLFTWNLPATSAF